MSTRNVAQEDCLSLRAIALTLVFWALLLCTPSAVSSAVITVPSDLHAGDTYRLVFVTTATRNATSANIEDYNSFVRNVVATTPQLASLGTTWSAIASTVSRFARDNTGTGSAYGSGFPVYRLDDLRVASDYGDLWDGSIQNPIQITEWGQLLPPSYLVAPGWFTADVWTGSGAQGAWNYALGSPDSASIGTAWATDWRWITNFPFPGGSSVELYQVWRSYHFYAMSGLLHVLAGDVNRDGLVNGQDITMAAGNWLQPGNGDANNDGIVNGQDIALIASTWLQNAGGTGGGGSGTAVPEPSAIILVMIGSLALLVRRLVRPAGPQ